MMRIDVKIGFKCNNRCRFCVQGDKRYRFGNKDFNDIKDFLYQNRKDYYGIVLTGGEATIRKDFLDIVRLAKEYGYKSILIQTNGRMFADPGFVKATIDAGATEYSPALHGHIPELHDYLTRAEGSFKQTVRGIINIKKFGGYLTTNTVITKSNFRHLPEIAALLVSLGVDQYQFAFVHAVGEAGNNFRSVVPRKSMIVTYVKRGLDVGLMRGRIAMTEAIPYCFMQGYEACVAELRIPDTKILDAELTVENYTEFRLTAGKLKGEPCRDCTFERVCEGPWREYPEVYGWDEFIPRKEDPKKILGSLIKEDKYIHKRYLELFADGST